MFVSPMAPLIPVAQPSAVSVEDVEYTRHAGEPLLARIYRPIDTVPTAAIVDVHGGAWVVGDRTQHQALDQALAATGALVMAVDFRQPPGHPYPESLEDVNLAIRWLKLNRDTLGVAPEAPVGAFGGSSGGHVVILTALRALDGRYSTLPLPGGENLDARLDFVLTDAPVTDPLARYLRALRENLQQVVERHHLYWPNEAAVIDGNPNLILARGEPVDLPPLLVTQSKDDQSVLVALTREFVERYVRAGGRVQFHTFDGLSHGFILQEPDRPESIRQAEMAITFVKAQRPR